MIDANRATVVPNRVRPAVKHHFLPISEYESCMFAALHAKETLAEVDAIATGRKTRLPRFSLLRGEVALLAERVRHITRGTP
jgi:hypothetical protein